MAEPLAEFLRQGGAHSRPARLLSHGHERGHRKGEERIGGEQGRADDVPVPFGDERGASFAGQRRAS